RVQGPGAMNRRSFETCLVDAGGTLRDAMAAIEAGESQIALAVEPDGRIVGLTTDGDIRRALLAGCSMDGPLAPHLNRSFVSVGPSADRTQVLDLMRARRIEAIPVVADGRPVGLH